MGSPGVFSITVLVIVLPYHRGPITGQTQPFIEVPVAPNNKVQTVKKQNKHVQAVTLTPYLRVSTVHYWEYVNWFMV